MAKKPQMQVNVQSGSFKELLEIQKGAAQSLLVMAELMSKINKLGDVELKQKVRLKDLHEQEIKALQRKNELSLEEAKAIAKLASGMRTFPTLFERLQDKTKGLTDFIKNPMAGMRTGLLKATNIFGVNEKRLEREKFIKGQEALGVKKSFAEHAEDFQKAQQASKAIKKNEAKIAELKQQTGMSEKQLAGTESGKKLFEARKALTDEYAKHDVRAQGIKKPEKTPSSMFQESGKDEEAATEDAQKMEEQIDLLKKIEKNTDPDGMKKLEKARSPGGTEKEGGGLLSGLMGGGKIGNVVKSMKDFGVGIVAVAAGLWVASKAFKSFAEVEWADVGKGMVALFGFVAVAKILKGGMGDMIKASIGILALSGALYVSTKVFKEFSEIDWDSMFKAGAAIVGLGAAGAVLGNMLGTMLKGALGLTAMAGALWVIAEVLTKFEEIGWETMGKAAAAIAGLGLASLLLGPAAPMMIAAGAGLAVLGAGLWVIGEAMQAVGQGFKDMTDGIERIASLDGDNMWNVAKGLGAISVAMIAFGGAQAIAGIGNLVGKLLSFGQDSPMEQLEKIAKYGEGIGKAGAGMKDLGEGMKAFSSIKGDALNDTMKSLKQFPWEQATKFVAAGGAMSVDGGKVYNASKGNEDSKAANAGQGGGNSVTTIAPSTNVRNTTVQTVRPAIRNTTYTEGSRAEMDRRYRPGSAYY